MADERGRLRCGRCGRLAMVRVDTQRIDVMALPGNTVRRKTYRCENCNYLVRACEVIEAEVQRAFLRLR